MSIKLCQAANSVVTPLDDAQFYSWAVNRAAGIVAGCVVTSAGTNQLAISAGWGIVQGHVFIIGAETISAAVAPSGTVNGRLLIRIDTSDTVTPVEFVTQAATPLPALTQEDIDGSGSIYELPLATYDVGTISISGLANVAPTADKRQTAANTPIADAGGYFTSAQVEGALQEVAVVANAANKYASGEEIVIGEYNGKPLYRKVVEFGSLPASGVKTVAHGIANIDVFMPARGTAYRSTTGTTINLPFVTPTGIAPCVGIQYPDKNNILIEVGTDRSLFTGTVFMEYTKTTD